MSSEIETPVAEETPTPEIRPEEEISTTEIQTAETPETESPQYQVDSENTLDPLKRRKKSFSWKNFGGPGFLFSLIFHGIILIVAAFLLVRHIVIEKVEEPDAFVTGAGGGNNGANARMQQHRMKPRQNMIQSKARITSKSSNASIVLPEMPVVAMQSSFGATGMSAGGDSSGFGGGSGGGVGTGRGMGVGNGTNFVGGFGSRIKNQWSMKGQLFDLKRGSKGSTLATVEGNDQGRRKEQLHKALGILDSKWDVKELEKLYFRAPLALYSSRIFIVNEKGQALQATLATDAFADPPISEGGKPPFQAPGWLCYYEGKFSVPEDGEYRFVGMGDDAMIVGVGRETVLYAFWPGEGHGPAVKYKKGWEPADYCGKGGKDGTNLPVRGQRTSLYKGHWKKYKKGRKYTIKVAFGEATGGLAGACLGIQKKDRDSDDDFPIFTLEAMEMVPEWNLGETGRYNVSSLFSAQ